MLETPKILDTSLLTVDSDNSMNTAMGNQQATCASRESSTTTRETRDIRKGRNATTPWYPVPKEELDLIEAHLLGDGCLYRQSSTRNAKFALCRGNDHKAYVRYSWDRLVTLVACSIKSLDDIV